MYLKREIKRKIRLNSEDGLSTTSSRAARRGRPMKRASKLTPARNTRTSSAQKLQAQQTQQKLSAVVSLSAFERLPIEILQQIFFLSLEINLPRSSRFLSQVLSNPAIYRSLILLAYFQDDRHCPVETHHFLPAEYHFLDTFEQARLQEAIVSCKWFTFDRFCGCLSSLSSLTMVQEWYREKCLDEHYVNLPVTMSSYSEYPNVGANPLAQLPSLDDEKAVESHFLALRTFVPEREQPDMMRNFDYPSIYSLAITCWEVDTEYWDEDSQSGELLKALSSRKSTFAVRAIPPAVYRCRTNKQVNLLRILRVGREFMPYWRSRLPSLVVQPEILFDTMATAITSNRYNFLIVLLDLYTTFAQAHMGIMSYDEPERNTWNRHPLPLSLFHLAIEQKGTDWKFLSALMRGWLYSVPYDDERLTAWALRVKAKQQTDARARALASWLLQYMEDPPTNHSSARSVFSRGELNRDLFRENYDRHGNWRPNQSGTKKTYKTSWPEVCDPRMTFSKEISSIKDLWTTICEADD